MIRRWWRSTSLRQRLAILCAVVVVVALLGAVGGVVAFRGQRSSQITLTDEISPAAIATGKWSSAVHDQLTAAYAFTTTGEPTFVEDFRTAADRSESLEQAVRRALVGHPELLALVDDVNQDLETWRADRAEPAIAATQDAADATERGTGGVVESQIEGLRSSFAPVDRDLMELEEALDQRRAGARDDLERNTRDLLITSSLVVSLVLTTLALIWMMLNRWMFEPLRQVREDTRAVADGDLDHAVRQDGPPELQRLGRDVEAMRLRILDELTIVQSAVNQLEMQAADLSRSNAELEQFAYVASHDLQEPLRKVIGFCQLLQRRYEGQLDERADEYIAFAVDGAKRMQLLINDLLAFSRVGRNTDRFERVDLNRVMDAVTSELSGPIEEKDATVLWDDLPTVWGDPRLLHSLLANLTANALKFHGDDPPRITWSTARVTDHWELRCQDNGIGIEPRFAEQVFEIFQRLHTRENYAGTGIGLATARKIVEFHGGRIWVDTTDPDPGTTMVVTFPVTGSEAPPDPSDTGRLADALGIDRSPPARPAPEEMP